MGTLKFKLVFGLVLLAGGLFVIGVGAEFIDLEPQTDEVVDESPEVQAPQVVVNSPHNVCPTPEPWRNHW